VIKFFTKSLQSHLKNIDYAFKGYDAIRGNPHSNSVDPGFRARIFAPRLVKKETTADQIWYVPDGIEIVKVDSCDTNSSSRDIKGAKSYQTSLSVDASIEGGLGAFAFSASAGFKDVSQSTEEQGTFFIENKADCRLYKVTLNVYDPPKLDPKFLIGLKSLGDYPAKKESYCKFFKFFGTHVPESIILGSRFGHITKIQTVSSSSSRENTVSAGIGASYLGVEAKVSTEVSNKNSSSNSSNNTNKKSFSIGSTPDEEGNSLKWAQKEIVSPMPIKYELIQLTTALELTGKKEEILNEGISNFEIILSNMKKALNNYCNDCLVPAGLLLNCEAAKDKLFVNKMVLVETGKPFMFKNVETGTCISRNKLGTFYVSSDLCDLKDSRQHFEFINRDGFFNVVERGGDRKSFDIHSGSNDDGTELILDNGHNGNNQIFKFLINKENGLYTIVGLRSNKCLQVKDNSILAGARVAIYSCDDSLGQKWRLETF
jgi:hypothetical protein